MQTSSSPGVVTIGGAPAEDITNCRIGNLLRDFRPLFDPVAKFAEVARPLRHALLRPVGEVSH